MFNLFPQKTSDCERGSRRRFLLQVGSLSGYGLSLDMLLRAQSAQAANTNAPTKDVNCILIWTRGGTSHHDSLDPKPLAKAEVRGDFSAIDTAIPGIQFSDQMPHFAKSLKSFTVMRNLNPLNGSHSTAEVIMMSGKKFNPSVTFPCFGSVVAKEHGYRHNMPPFIQVGTQVDHRFNGGLAGFLGIEYNAFVLPGDPNSKRFSVRDVTLSRGMTTERLQRRQNALKQIDTFQRQLENQPQTLQAMDDYYHHAFSMMTSPKTKKAFDLSREDTKTRNLYGRTNIGQSCLLARRLIEAGTRFVTVSSGGWDTHRNNFSALKRLLPPLDQAFPALVQDLKQRGMLENTFVLWMTDFGRTPIINSATGRDHWATASMACFAGAGTPEGQVIGQTDATGSKPVGKEYHPQDTAATVYQKLGIPLDTVHHAPDGRPIKLCEGKPVPELMG